MPLILSLYNRLVAVADQLAPAVLLIIRLWIARVFFLSGLVKIEDMETTVALFADEYQVPVLPPVFAAYSATLFELLCPILLVLGLATRAAVLPLLAMTAVIQFTYDQNIQHYYWAMLLAMLLTHGAGAWSADAVLSRKSASSAMNA